MNEKPVWKNWFEESLYIQRIQVYNLKKFHAFQAQKKERNSTSTTGAARATSRERYISFKIQM